MGAAIILTGVGETQSDNKDAVITPYDVSLAHLSSVISAMYYSCPTIQNLVY